MQRVRIHTPSILGTLTILSALLACGSERPTNGAPTASPTAAPVATHTEEPDDTAPAPASELRPDGVVISLACGRATATLPDGFHVTEDVELCEDRGYPESLEADGIGGGTSDHPIVGHDCTLTVESNDSLPDPRAPTPAEGIRSTDRAATFMAVTAEGTVLQVSVTVESGAPTPSPACASLCASLATVLHDSLTIAPLRDTTTHTRAQISSAGHGLVVELPNGYWIYSLGGGADEYETAYRLFGPSDTTATLFTSWDPDADPSAPVRRFEPRVLVGALRLTPDAGYDPITDTACRRTTARGPEQRILTNIDFCGPPAGDAALAEILRTMRFTPPPAAPVPPTPG